MFIPPFFSKNGHHIDALLADLIGLGFVVCGYLFGKAIFTLNAPHQSNTSSIVHWHEQRLFLAFIILIYSVRITLFLDIGIYAFLHPYARDSSLLDTVTQKLAFPYIVFLIAMFERHGKRVYLILILIEVIVFILPVMARSYYLLLPIYWLLVRYHLKGRGLKAELVTFAPIILVALIFVGIVGPFINSVRSYATIGKVDKGLELKFEKKDVQADFLLKRFNIHDEAFNIAPFIKEAATLDTLAFESMWEKWTGISPNYRIHPTSISTELGLYYGSGAKTATDFPRNFILINSDFGISKLVTFNLLYGFLLCVSYMLILKYAGILFIVLWVPFVFAPAFSLQGSMPSVFVFQYVFLCFSWALIFLLYQMLKLLFASCSAFQHLVALAFSRNR